MSRQKVRLLTFKGIDVKIDWTWLILAFIIVTSLSASFFPVLMPDRSPLIYWGLGFVGALGLFASIVFHEFAHALVGRRFGMKTTEITLFLFGGVAQLEDEPPSAAAEFNMAIAGPAASVLLAIGTFGLLELARAQAWPQTLQVLFAYYSTTNVILAAFNMLPGFPLDGGRVLRAILWSYKKDLAWATKVASGIGQFFGYGLMILGGVSFIGGNLLSGIWLFFLGLLLTNFAKLSYLQMLIRQSLRGRPASVFMNSQPATVSPNAPVSELVSERLLREEQIVYPVVHNEELVGCVDMRRLKEIPEDEWGRHPIREITQACTTDWQINPDDDAESAFKKMSRTGHQVLMVIREGRLLGVLSQKGLFRYLTLKQT